MNTAEKDAMLDRLQSDPAICGGQVCVKGTRIPVTLILDAPPPGRRLKRRRSMPNPNSPEEKLLQKIKSLPPDKLSQVEDFVDFLRQRGDDRRRARAVTRLSEDAFHKVWNHPDDADYDRL